MGYHCDVLIERASEAQSVRELFRTASPRLRRLVDFDAAVWLATDPGTGLPTAPTFVENLDHLGRGPCERVWELEFQVDDVNLYRDLAGAAVPAGALRLSTDDRPARSHRYCDLLHPNGLGDEKCGLSGCAPATSSMCQAMRRTASGTSRRSRP